MAKDKSGMSRCPRCDVVMTEDNTNTCKSGKRVGQFRGYCKKCTIDYNRDWEHKTGRSRPMAENKDCAAFLGVVVAENLLANVFKTVERMPTNHPGYDFWCPKGYKIDSKISTLSPKRNCWQFRIHHNTVADYFACIAINDRDNIEPVHFWLIPGEVVNYLKSCLEIGGGEKSLAKWAQYEKPIDKIVKCCTTMKG